MHNLFLSFFSQQHQEWSDRMWIWQNAFLKVKSACWITWLWFTQVSLLYLGTTLQCKLSHLLDHQAGLSVFSALASYTTMQTVSPVGASGWSLWVCQLYLGITLQCKLPVSLVGLLGWGFTAYLGLLSLPWHHTTLQTTSLTCWIIRLGFIWVCLLRF